MPIRSTCCVTLRTTRLLGPGGRGPIAYAKRKGAFFEQYRPEARAILSDLLEKYAENGTAQFVIPDVLKVPPISDRGNVMEIASMFGGPEQLKDAVGQLQTLLYAA